MKFIRPQFPRRLATPPAERVDVWRSLAIAALAFASRPLSADLVRSDEIPKGFAVSLALDWKVKVVVSGQVALRDGPFVAPGQGPQEAGSGRPQAAQ